MIWERPGLDRAVITSLWQLMELGNTNGARSTLAQQLWVRESLVWFRHTRTWETFPGDSAEPLPWLPAPDSPRAHPQERGQCLLQRPWVCVCELARTPSLGAAGALSAGRSRCHNRWFCF